MLFFVNLNPEFAIKKSQRNLSIVYILVSCEEKGYYRAVLVGQLAFVGRSYCGRSCRMQGEFKCKI